MIKKLTPDMLFPGLTAWPANWKAFWRAVEKLEPKEQTKIVDKALRVFVK